MPYPRVYFSVRSPYSRLGLHMVSRAKIDVDLIIFLRPKDGTFQDPVANQPKLQYYMQDAPRMTMRMGLPMAMPNPFDVDYSFANNAIAAAIQEGFGLPYAIALSDVRWGNGKNVSDMNVLKSAAEAIGWSAERVETAQKDHTIQDQMDRFHEKIAEDQVFGVPFAVNGEQKFWGHDRFDLFIDSFSGAKGSHQ